MPRKHNSVWNCLDCNTNTKIGDENYYMVLNSIWIKYVAEEDRGGMLCLKCLQNRMKRLLKYEDFTICPLNSNNPAVQRKRRDSIRERRLNG